MSDDIVIRLREATQVYENQWHEECREAAEEIEHLRNLLRRTVYLSTDYGLRHLQWMGGGYDSESMEVSDEEAALLEHVQSLPYCYGCERILSPGESMWTVGRSVYCDDHWAEYKERQQIRGRTIKEEF